MLHNLQKVWAKNKVNSPKWPKKLLFILKANLNMQYEIEKKNNNKRLKQETFMQKWRKCENNHGFTHQIQKT